MRVHPGPVTRNLMAALRAIFASPDWEEIRKLAPLEVPEELDRLDSLVRALRRPEAPSAEQIAKQREIEDRLGRLVWDICNRKVHRQERMRPLPTMAPRRSAARSRA
jgi:hypothetical protein